MRYSQDFFLHNFFSIFQVRLYTRKGARVFVQCNYIVTKNTYRTYIIDPFYKYSFEKKKNDIKSDRKKIRYFLEGITQVVNVFFFRQQCNLFVYV